MKLRALLLVASGALIGRTLRAWYTQSMAYDGYKSDNAPERYKVPIEVGEMDAEDKRIFENRFDELVEAGFDELLATTLALTKGDAWRNAIRHVKRGAAPRVAAEIEL